MPGRQLQARDSWEACEGKHSQVIAKEGREARGCMVMPEETCGRQEKPRGGLENAPEGRGKAESPGKSPPVAVRPEKARGSPGMIDPLVPGCLAAGASVRKATGRRGRKNMEAVQKAEVLPRDLKWS